MGGTAFLIWGTVQESLLKQESRKQSLFDRILRRKPGPSLQRMEMGPGHVFYDLPSPDFNKLKSDFLDFLNNAAPHPWTSSVYVLDYIKQNAFETYLRGEQNAPESEIEWYIQISFPDCAGLAAVSAEVGAHWADIWFSRNKDRISQEYLIPFGFTPSRDQKPFNQNPVFLPLGRLGYGLYMGDEPIDLEEDLNRPTRFELDEGLIEELEIRRELPDLKSLELDLAEQMTDGKCKCQLCSPDFDQSLSDF